ncbi:MAG: hypothetical protein H6741_04090 [Alphaproteobacteria bacterium]|nr:hypothetical protein [Alphaproteobacteria bacterium]
MQQRELALPSGVELPQRLSPGSGFTLAVEYAPDQVAPHEGELLIRSNDPENPVVSVRLLGNAEGTGLGPPTVEITSPDWGNYLLLGEVAELRGCVVDDADPPPNLLTAWYSDSQLVGVVTAPLTAPGQVALDTDALPLGEQTLTLRAVDSAGNQRRDDVDVVGLGPGGAHPLHALRRRDRVRLVHRRRRHDRRCWTAW